MTAVYPFLLNQACNSGTAPRLEPCRHSAGDHWAERLWGESDGVFDEVKWWKMNPWHIDVRLWLVLYIMNYTSWWERKIWLLILMISIVSCGLGSVRSVATKCKSKVDLLQMDPSRVRVEANPLHNPLTKCLVWLPGFQKLPFVKWIDTPTRPFLIIFLHHGDPTCATSMRCNELQVPFARELESDDELLAPAEAEAPISPVTAAIARRNTETDKSEIYQWFKEHHFLILFNFYVWVVVWGHALKPHFALFGNQQFGVHPPPVAKASSIAEQCGRGA